MILEQYFTSRTAIYIAKNSSQHAVEYVEDILVTFP